MSASSYQLPIEETLKAFIVAKLILPAAFPIHCAHAAEAIESEPDYLSIIARKPRGELAYAGNPELPVEFWLVHSIADAEGRAAQVQFHSDRAAALIDLFDFDNTDAALAELRVLGVAKGLGFSGWEANPEIADDGKTPEGDKLVDKQGYLFDCHLL